MIPAFCGAAARYGERVVLGLDARQGRVATDGWTASSARDALIWPGRWPPCGLKEVIYTDIARDGMLLRSGSRGLDPAGAPSPVWPWSPRAASLPWPTWRRWRRPGRAAPSSVRPSMTDGSTWVRPYGGGKGGRLMLAKRIIPCLDIRAGRVVKGTSFLNLRDAGDPVELAAFYDAEGADELVFLDITASHEAPDDRRRGGAPGWPSGSSSRSPWAAGSPAWRRCGPSCARVPTRSRSTAPRWPIPELLDQVRRGIRPAVRGPGHRRQGAARRRLGGLHPRRAAPDRSRGRGLGGTAVSAWERGRSS